MTNTKRQRILDLLTARTVLRPRDLEELGISGSYLNKLYSQGVITRLGRGLYSIKDALGTENSSLIEACARVPKGTICLLSALRFYDLTTQAPFEVWMSISDKARLPRVDYPPLRIVRFSGAALTYGTQLAKVDGSTIRVYSPAKTVADCFKYRNKIGLDVAMEALRDCRKQKRATMDELWEAAKVCRMSNVMRPYLESLT